MSGVETYNITVYQGDDTEIPIYFFGEDRTPEDLSSLTARMQVRANRNGNAPHLLTSTSEPGGGLVFNAAPYEGDAAPAAPNGIVLTVSAAQSLGMQDGTYAYDLFLRDEEGKQHLRLRGTFTVMATVTRAS